jgi:hypothetical protein
MTCPIHPNGPTYQGQQNTQCTCGQLAAISGQINAAHSQMGAAQSQCNQSNYPVCCYSHYAVHMQQNMTNSQWTYARGKQQAQGLNAWIPKLEHWMEGSELTDIELVAEHLNRVDAFIDIFLEACQQYRPTITPEFIARIKKNRSLL